MLRVQGLGSGVGSSGLHGLGLWAVGFGVWGFGVCLIRHVPRGVLGDDRYLAADVRAVAAVEDVISVAVVRQHLWCCSIKGIPSCRIEMISLNIGRLHISGRVVMMPWHIGSVRG